MLSPARCKISLEISGHLEEKLYCALLTFGKSFSLSANGHAVRPLKHAWRPPHFTIIFEHCQLHKTCHWQCSETSLIRIRRHSFFPYISICIWWRTGLMYWKRTNHIPYVNCAWITCPSPLLSHLHRYWKQFHFWSLTNYKGGSVHHECRAQRNQLHSWGLYTWLMENVSELRYRLIRGLQHPIEFSADSEHTYWQCSSPSPQNQSGRI